MSLKCKLSVGIIGNGCPCFSTEMSWYKLKEIKELHLSVLCSCGFMIRNHFRQI